MQALINEIKDWFFECEGQYFGAVVDAARANYPGVILYGEQPIIDHPTKFMLDIYVNTESCCSEKIGRIYFDESHFQAGNPEPETTVEA
jgi:hypothetical protein